MSADADIIKVYYCYAKEDEELRNRLTAHLSPLRRARKLTIWFDHLVQPSSNYQMEVEEQLKKADLILLLITPDFFASDYCDKLLSLALNQYEAGRVDIVPILLRPVLWKETSVKDLPLILPTSELEVTLWLNQDEALKNIAAAIRDLIQARLAGRRKLSADEVQILQECGEPVLLSRCPVCGAANRIGAKFCTKDGIDLLSSRAIITPLPVPPQRTPEEWVREGQRLARQEHYADALAAYEQALLLDAHYVLAFFYKGHVLYRLRKYNQALACYEQAARLAPGSPEPLCYQGHALRHLQRYSEALDTYEQALGRATGKISAAAWSGKGHIYYEQKSHKEALDAYEQAVRADPDSAEPYLGQGRTLYDLQRYDEALAACEQAARLDDLYAAPHFYRGNVLFVLWHYKEALEAYDAALQRNPSYGPAYHGKGRVYKELGLSKEAQAAFDRAARLNSDLDSDVP
jgi:tetratricopeptide (TPR) repeat protein